MKPFSWSSPWYAWPSSLHYLFLFVFFVYPFIVPRLPRSYRGAVIVFLIIFLISWCCSLPIVIDAYILVTSPPRTTQTTLTEKHIATNPNRSRVYELKFEHNGPFDSYYVVPKEVYDAVEIAQCYRVTTHDGYIWHSITFLERIPCAEVDQPN